MNYVVKDELILFLTPAKYAEVEQRLRTSLGKSRVNLKDVKKYLAARPEFITALRKHQIGATAFQKYNQAVGRKPSPCNRCKAKINPAPAHAQPPSRNRA